MEQNLKRKGALSKGFPIRSLPDVVMREVLRQMDLPTIYRLSLCSKRTKQILKWNMFKVDELWMKVSNLERNIKPSIKIGSKLYDISVFERDWHCDRIFTSRHTFSDMQTLEEAHRHLCDLFGVSGQEMFVKLESFVDLALLTPETVTRCQFHFNFCSDTIFDFLTKQNRLQLVMTETSRRSMTLKEHSALRRIPEVMHDDGNRGSQLFFTHFQGKHALLKNMQLHEFYVTVFMRLWSRQQVENLETLIAIQGSAVLFDPSKVLELMQNPGGIKDTKVEKWDPLKRPRVYPYQSIITEYHTFPPDTFDCKDGIDIVRDSDGKRATVKISPRYFMFFVWK